MQYRVFFSWHLRHMCADHKPLSPPSAMAFSSVSSSVL